MKKENWVDNIVEKIIKRFPDQNKYILAAGITPSGPVHVGNLRDVITSHFVQRALVERGYNAEVLFFWDDFDRLRKIPRNIPVEFSNYLGMPVSEIPDPFGCHNSYAEHFEKEFEESVEELGIKVTIISQSEMYKLNKYYKYIKTSLEKRKDIWKILAKFKTQAKETMENYWPLRVYCKKCGKDQTEIVKYDVSSEELSYVCRNCGNEETINIRCQNPGKLSWRVDWAMRWACYNIHFEPGGKDHAVKGGSYDTSREIVEKIFRHNAPVFQGYEFVVLKGSKGKMSSSEGILVTPKELLKIYEPEIIRYIFAKNQPMSVISIDLGEDVIKTYAEFDRDVENCIYKKKCPRYMDFCKLSSSSMLEVSKASFRQIATLGQAVQGNLNVLKTIFMKLGLEVDDNILRRRWNKAKYWLDKYCQEFKIQVRNELDIDYFNKLSNEEKEEILTLADEIDRNFDSIQTLESFLYAIPKKKELSEIEDKKRQRRFFRNVYMLILGKETGPRLSTLLYALGIDKIKSLLLPLKQLETNFVAKRDE